MSHFGYSKSQVNSALKCLARRKADGTAGTLVVVQIGPGQIHPYPAVPFYKGSLVVYTLNERSPFGMHVQ